MQHAVRVLLALAGLLFLPAASSNDNWTCSGSGGGDCRCIPNLCIKPVGCNCTLQISNLLHGITQCVFFVPPNKSHFKCGRYQGGHTYCAMSFKAKEIAVGGCGTVFSPQSTPNIGCGGFVQWTLPCSGGGSHLLQVTCSDCPYIIDQ